MENIQLDGKTTNIPSKSAFKSKSADLIFIKRFKGTVMQIEKALISDYLGDSTVS